MWIWTVRGTCHKHFSHYGDEKLRLSRRCQTWSFPGNAWGTLRASYNIVKAPSKEIRTSVIIPHCISCVPPEVGKGLARSHCPARACWRTCAAPLAKHLYNLPATRLSNSPSFSYDCDSVTFPSRTTKVLTSTNLDLGLPTAENITPLRSDYK